MSDITSEQWTKIQFLLGVVVILIVVFGVVAFITSTQRRESEMRVDASKKKMTLAEFFGVNVPFPKLMLSIVVGMVSGIIFGFIDNAGLFFGMDSLEPVFEKYFPFGDDDNVKAGLGNTFSDFVGAFLGTFAALIVKSVTFQDDSPFWAESVGLIVGCLIGCYVPFLILRSKRSKK